jgi:hypothetical protein
MNSYTVGQVWDQYIIIHVLCFTEMYQNCTGMALHIFTNSHLYYLNALEFKTTQHKA